MIRLPNLFWVTSSSNRLTLTEFQYLYQSIDSTRNLSYKFHQFPAPAASGEQFITVAAPDNVVVDYELVKFLIDSCGFPIPSVAAITDGVEVEVCYEADGIFVRFNERARALATKAPESAARDYILAQKEWVPVIEYITQQQAAVIEHRAMAGKDPELPLQIWRALRIAANRFLEAINAAILQGQSIQEEHRCGPLVLPVLESCQIVHFTQHGVPTQMLRLDTTDGVRFHLQVTAERFRK